MNLRSWLLGMSMISAVVGLTPACGDGSDLDEGSEQEVLVDGQESALTVGDVRVTARVDRTSAKPGERVVIATNLTAATSYYYQVRAEIVRPDGSRLVVSNLGTKYLRKNVQSSYQATWTVGASEKAGNYAVSVVVTPIFGQGPAQTKNGLATVSVTGATTEPPTTQPPTTEPPTTQPPTTEPPTTQPPTTQPPSSSQVLSISGRHILDRAGKIFTARGPELVTADVSQVSEIDAIAATGANAMRMLLTLDTANRMTPQTFDQLLGRAVSNRLVVWISLFAWDDSKNREIAPALGGGNLLKTADYLTVWQRQWLKDLIKKYQGSVVIDAMQEFKSTVRPPESPAAVREWVDTAKEHLRFFRQQGYTQPLEIMTSFEGRDLAAIVANADEILGADTLTRNNTKQTLFGWQAYWGPGFYENWQGGLLVGRPITAVDAVKQFVLTRNYPIMVGLDSIDIPGSESYGTLMPACSSQAVGWLWWEWNELKSSSWGQTVRTSRDGFAGATKASQ